MDKIAKFLLKIDATLRSRLQKILMDIIENRLEGLDIKPLKGAKNFYRCRVGNIRIIFMKGRDFNHPTDIDFRGNIYKK